MRVIVDFFSNPIVLFSMMSILTLVAFTIMHFKISVSEIARTAVDKSLTYRMRIDHEKTRKREQLSKMGKDEKKWVRKYRMAVNSIKIALGMNFFSVENFTTMFILFGLLVFGIASFLLNNIFFGLMVAIPSVFGMLAFLLVITKRRIRYNDNAVMEALDAICPTVNVGIVNAIKMNKESFNRKLVPHFEWFLAAIEFQGYSFDEAIDELANRLGPRFHEFADKAKTFEAHYRDGMEDIFKDIVESNNDVRLDNAELDEVYMKANSELMLIAAILLGFLGYMYINPSTSSFMIDTFLGTFISAIEISLLILIYAVSQLMQVDIPDIKD